MNNYITTTEFESQLVDGLRYILRKISHGRRIDLNKRTAEISAKLREAMNRLVPISEQVDDAWEAAKIAPKKGGDPEVSRPPNDSVPPPGLPPEVWVEYRKLRVETIWNDLRVGQLYPILIRWAIKDITGWEIDGQPVTVDSLLAEAPDDVIVEIGTEIEHIINMPLEEQLGFKLPGTSSTQGIDPTVVTNA